MRNVFVDSNRIGLAFGACTLVVSLLVAPNALADDEGPGSAASKNGEAPAAGVSANVAPVRHGSAFVDPAGFLLFGPRVGVELGDARLSAALYGRWFNLGLLSHSLFLGAGDNFGFSYGAGVRGRAYRSDGMQGAHIGLAAEYLRSRIETPSALVATESAYFVPQAEVGYRLTLGTFYADASAALGYAFKLSGKVENLPGGTGASSYEAQDKSSIYASASLDLGFYF